MNSSQCWDLRCGAKEAEVDIFGVVGELSYFGESNTSADFIRALRGVGKGVNRLNVNIDSEGGSVWDGLAMYRAIRDFQAEKVVHVNSKAFSIATVIALAGDRIEVAPEAAFMIHNPIAGVIGGEKDFEDGIALLRNAKKSILDIYHRRTGADREQLSDLMDNTTWMYGEEIKAAGFADVVKKDQPKVRVAAGPLTLLHLYRNVPKNFAKPKPSNINPELAERLKKLKEAV